MIIKYKDEPQTFDSQRKCILAESKITLDHRQNSDTSIIRILRTSKKNRNVYEAIKALSAYSFKLINTKEGIKVERFYKAKDILSSCAFYQQNECSPAFIESVALTNKNKALKIVEDTIIKAEEKVDFLTKTITALSENSELNEIYCKKLELVKSSLAKKVTLLQIAKNL